MSAQNTSSTQLTVKFVMLRLQNPPNNFTSVCMHYTVRISVCISDNYINKLNETAPVRMLLEIFISTYDPATYDPGPYAPGSCGPGSYAPGSCGPGPYAPGSCGPAR